jgi:hypothetical protein
MPRIPSPEQLASISALATGLGNVLAMLPAVGEHVHEGDALTETRVEAFATDARLRHAINATRTDGHGEPFAEIAGWPIGTNAVLRRLLQDLEAFRCLGYQSPLPMQIRDGFRQTAEQLATLVSKSTDETAMVADATNPDPELLGMLGPSEIAIRFSRAPEPLRKRLDGWRKKHPEESGSGWIEVTDRKPRDSGFLYHVPTVQHVVNASPASSERPAKKFSG